MVRISKKELEQMSQFLREKSRKRQKKLDERYNQAVKDFDDIVEMIIKKFKPVRIYQWGSLLNKKYFNEYSDIDIAVEGLESPKDFFALLGEAEKLTSFPIDIVEIDKIHPLYAASIRKEGKIIYEKK